jgi:hypothetical protein
MAQIAGFDRLSPLGPMSVSVVIVPDSTLVLRSSRKQAPGPISWRTTE